MTIAEGEPVTVAAVNFVGFDVDPARPPRRAARSSCRSRSGSRATASSSSRRTKWRVNELNDHGYPYAKVSTNEDDGADGKQATLTFTAEPGQDRALRAGRDRRATRASATTSSARELTFKPGDLYRRSVVQDSQRRLYGMELFQFANIEPLNPELQPAEVPIRVTVAEGNHQRVNFGVGYGTEEKARVDAEYHHVNFLGGARSAGAHAR